MGLYDRDYMRADRNDEDTKPHRPKIWSILVGVILIASFLAFYILRQP